MVFGRLFFPFGKDHARELFLLVLGYTPKNFRPGGSSQVEQWLVITMLSHLVISRVRLVPNGLYTLGMSPFPTIQANEGK